MRSYRKSVIISHYMPPGARKNCYTFLMWPGYKILTTVTADPDEVAEWIQSIDIPDLIYPRPQYYALEIEVDLRTNRIGTLQLCAGQKSCLVFQLPGANAPPCLPPALIEFLADGNNYFVSTDIVSKVGLLRTMFPFEGEVKVDEVMVEREAFVRDMKQSSMMVELGETNWDRLPHKLSSEQVHYAALNAFLNLYVQRLWNPRILLSDGFYRQI